MLEPYRVLDLTDEREGFAGFLMALLGADVVAVERAGRAPDHRRLAYGRGKRSVVVDPASDQLTRLVEGADVLIETGLPPGWDAARLDAANPALVHVAITPFGPDGPKAAWPDDDLVLWAASGAMANCGDADRPPVRPSVPQAWCHAGAAAVAGALGALTERARSGRGQRVEVAVQQAGTIATQSTLLAPRYRSPIPRRTSGGLTIDKVAYRGLYPAADGWVTITHVFGAVVGPFTRRLMEWACDEGHCDEAMVAKDWIHYEQLLNEGREPLEEWERAKAAVESLTRSKTKAELLQGAIERRLVMAPISTVADVVANPQLEDRDFWDDVDGIRQPGLFVRGAAITHRRLPAAPVPGADTAAVLAEPVRRPAVSQRIDVESTQRIDPAERIDVESVERIDGSQRIDVESTSPAARRGGRGDERPLAGVKVVDLMWAVAGPSSARVLADLGATVVRVESSRRQDPARNYSPYLDGVAGPERSGIFNNQNAGKLGITLDLTRPEGREVLVDLAAWADVLMESYSPRAMAGWGLGYDVLSARNPSLVMLSSCLFGQTGPMAGFAGFGNLASALVGFHELTGWPDRPPVGPYGAYTDYCMPDLMASVVLAALDHRRRTGESGHLDFSQAEAALHYLSPAIVELQTSGRLPTRRGNDDPSASPHGVWPCGGEGFVALSCRTDEQRAALARLLGEQPLDAWMAARAAAEAQAELVAVGVAAHEVQGPAQADRDPQLAHLGHWVEVDHPVHGGLTVEATRFRLSRTPVGPRSAGPMLNQHRDEVLTGFLGYPAERVAGLDAAGVLS